jgi:two-component system cell cycle sensor histidine kinase/response regulator CckA
MVVAALRRRGYTVIAARTGEEALAAIEERGAEIGVLLTDVIMPGIGGYELVARARSVRSDLRAIVMSGYTALSIERGEVPPDVTFLEKPFTLATLDEAIHTMLGD